MNFLENLADYIRNLFQQDRSSGDVIVEVPTLHANISPLGFYRYATEYYDAASAITRRESFSPVPYYLYCRSLELALKAFLLTKGLTKRDLKGKFGHNLAKLLNRAKRKGLPQFLPIQATEEAAIRDVNDYYKSKALEYFDVYRAMTGYRGLPDLPILAEFNSKLLVAIEEECKRFVRNN